LREHKFGKPSFLPRGRNRVKARSHFATPASEIERKPVYGLSHDRLQIEKT